MKTEKTYDDGWDDGYKEAKEMCWDEAFQDGIYQGRHEGYEEGYEDAASEISSFDALMRKAGLDPLEDFRGRWDAAERRWRIAQDGRVVYLPKDGG